MALHIQHTEELREERADNELAIRATFSGRCATCDEHITMGDDIWWHPSSGAIRHRGAACDVHSPETKTQPKAADLKDFQATVQQIKDQWADDNAALMQRVGAAEQAATRAEQRVEKAEAKINATRKLEVIRTTDGAKKVRKLKAQHANFEKLLKLASVGINVALVGDTGSGKTYAGSALAKALGLDFYHIPLGPQTSKSDLLGFINGAGKYVYSLLCRVYEQGGVGLLDEMDAANPATLTIVNGMLEAIEAGFADKMRERHRDCVFVAAMNTFGRGADMMFVGRAQLDAATLNRWYYLNWNTDWDLTRRIVKDDKWVNYVESLYDSASRQRVRVTIGMRTAIMGKKAMEAGDTREEAEHGVIWAPIKPDDKQKILAGISQNGGASS